MMLFVAVPTVLQEYGLAILAVFTAVIGFIYRAYLAAIFPKDLSLIREKPGHKHFSLWTRASFYFNCSGLYRDVWDKVYHPLIYIHLYTWLLILG